LQAERAFWEILSDQGGVNEAFVEPNVFWRGLCYLPDGGDVMQAVAQRGCRGVV